MTVPGASRRRLVDRRRPGRRPAAGGSRKLPASSWARSRASTRSRRSGVAAAGLVAGTPPAASGRADLQGGDEDRLVVGVRGHGSWRPAWPCVCRYSARIGAANVSRNSENSALSRCPDRRVELGRAARPGRTPSRRSAVAAETPSASAASSTRQPGEEPELDQLGRLRGRRRPAGRAPRRGRAGRPVGRSSGRRRRSRSTRGAAAAALRGSACGGRSRRGCGAWPRRRRRRSGRGRSSAAAWLAAHQPQVGLVDQGRRLERLARLLLRQPLGGQLAQLVVDERQELLGGGRVAVLDRGQDPGDVGHAAEHTPGPGRRATENTSLARLVLGASVRHPEGGFAPPGDETGATLRRQPTPVSTPRYHPAPAPEPPQAGAVGPIDRATRLRAGDGSRPNPPPDTLDSVVKSCRGTV